MVQECEELVIWQELIPNKDEGVAKVNRIDADHSIEKESKTHGHSMSSQDTGAVSDIHFVGSENRPRDRDGHRQRNVTPGLRSTSRNRSTSRGRRPLSSDRGANRDLSNRRPSEDAIGHFPQKTGQRRPSVRFNSECFKCHKRGHFAKECRSGRPRSFHGPRRPQTPHYTK